MIRLTAAERERIEERARDPEGCEHRERAAEAERLTDRRLWAAVMLSADLGVCRSILRGDAVLARQLDAVALRRAQRGGPLPPPGSYIAISAAMLDAVAEGAAFISTKARTHDE